MIQYLPDPNEVSFVPKPNRIINTLLSEHNTENVTLR